MPATLAQQVRSWVAETWDPSLALRTWWARLAAAGYAFPSWPEGYGGRSLSPDAARTVAQELLDAGVAGPPQGIGSNLAGPTILEHGADEQQDRFLPGIATGVDAWCQLFSEPGAGSDLAALQARAVADADGWVVSGQKVWNSGASRATYGLLLARTDVDVPKHAGLSYFLLDMQQPGVDARPLRQMNGDADFDEVFLTDARIGPGRLVASVGDGWMVANTTLAHERSGIGARGGAAASFPAGEGYGVLDLPVGELVARARSAQQRPISGYVIGNRQMVGLAHDHGRSSDPVARQRLAAYRSAIELNRLTGRRAKAAAVGRRPGPESSVGKLAMSQLARSSRDLGLGLLGAHGMLAGADAPHDGAVQHVALSSFAAGIGGGTDEIQRNVIGERALGLPREPQVDRDVPFRELVRGHSRGAQMTEASKSSVRMSEEEAWRFVEEAHTGVLTTLRRDGRPVSMPVWFVALDRTVYVQTRGKKLVRVRNDPRASFLVEAGTRWSELRAVHLDCVASVLTPDEQLAGRIGAEMDRKYAAHRTRPAEMPAATREHYRQGAGATIELVAVGKVLTWDNRKLST